jgi:hypothetical protein
MIAMIPKHIYHVLRKTCKNKGKPINNRVISSNITHFRKAHRQIGVNAEIHPPAFWSNEGYEGSVKKAKVSIVKNK